MDHHSVDFYTGLPASVELSCSSESACQGVVGPSRAAQYMSKGVGLLTPRPPQELFVTTATAGRTWVSTPFPPSYWVSTLACPEASDCVVMGISKVAYEPVSKQQLEEYPPATRIKIPKRYPGCCLLRPVDKRRRRHLAEWYLAPSGGIPEQTTCATSSNYAALDLTTIPRATPCPSDMEALPERRLFFFSTEMRPLRCQTSSPRAMVELRGKLTAFPATVPLPTMSALYCPSSSECWVTGSEAVPQVIGRLHDGGSSVILHTTDGGLTWSRTTFAVPAGAPNPYGQSFTNVKFHQLPDSEHLYSSR